MPGTLVDVAHLVAARVAQHELFAGGVNLSRCAAFTQAPAEVWDGLHCAASFQSVVPMQLCDISIHSIEDR